MDALNSKSRPSSSSDSTNGLARTVILTVVATLAFKFWIMFMALGIGLGYEISSLKSITIKLICVDVPVLIFVWTLVNYRGSIRAIALLIGRYPSLKEFVKWACLGMILNVRTFITSAMHGTHYENPEYVAFILMSTFSSSLIYPVVEEVLFRGFCYSTLRKYGKWFAFVISTLLFLLAHVPLKVAISGVFPLSMFQVAFFVAISAIATHIYESSGNLLLCITFHGAANFMDGAGQFVRYLSSQL